MLNDTWNDRSDPCRLRCRSINAFFLASFKAHSLAGKAYLAAGPTVHLDWEYDDRTRELIVSVINSGRLDTTIYDLRLDVVREIITSVSINGKAFDMHMVPVADVPKILWWKSYDSNILPLRLAASSRISVHVNSNGLSLPHDEFSIYDMQLRFVAETPNRYEIAYFRGDILRHFVGLEPDVPVRDRDPSILERHPFSWNEVLGNLLRLARRKPDETD